MNNQPTTSTIILLCIVIGVLGCTENHETKRSKRSKPSKAPPAIAVLEADPVPYLLQSIDPISDASMPPEAPPIHQDTPETLAEKYIRLKARLDDVERRATQADRGEV